jgi:hypothetical protein
VTTFSIIPVILIGVIPQPTVEEVTKGYVPEVTEIYSRKIKPFDTNLSVRPFIENP